MPWYPSVGSGFDQLAQQQQYYAGLSNATDRANAEAQQRAQEQQNAYLFNRAQIQRDAQAQAAALQQRAIDNQIAQYQFNQQMAERQQQNALKQESLDLGVQADAQNRADKMAQMGMAVSQDKSRERFNQASEELQNGTFDPNNYKDLPPDQLGLLNRALQAQRAPQAKTYFDAVKGASQLNMQGEIDSQIKQLTAKGATPPNPDFLTGLQQRSALLAKAAPDAKGQAMLGITLNDKTGKYEPPPAPSWLPSQSKYNQLAPSNTPAAPVAEASAIPATTGVTKSGVRYRIISPSTPTATPPPVSSTPVPLNNQSVSVTQATPPAGAATSTPDYIPAATPTSTPDVSALAAQSRSAAAKAQSEDAEIARNNDAIPFLQQQIKDNTKYNKSMAAYYQTILDKVLARQQWLKAVPHVGTPPPPVTRSWLGTWSF